MNNNMQKYLNAGFVVLDTLLIIISYILSWLLRFRTSLFGEPVRVLSFEYYMRFLLIVVPLFLIMNWVFSLYSSGRTHGRRHEAANIFKANTAGILIFILLLYFSKQIHFARNMLFVFYLLNMFLDFVVRNLARNFINRLRSGDFNRKTVLLVGYSTSAEEYIDRILANRHWGYNIFGILDDNLESGTEYHGVKVLGRLDGLVSLLEGNQVDEIAITMGLNEYYKLEKIVALCEKSGVHTMFIPDYYNIIPTKPYTEDMQGLPVINIRYVPLNNPLASFIKRTLDIIGSLLCIVIFSPAMLFALIGIKITSPGPVIFRQVRVGLHNREFEMYKFRSMKVQTEEEEKKGWTTKGDERITKFGSFIRKTSIDELPQLFNVLKGDMSLVGPRPERPQFVEEFRETIPRYMIKHQVRPGMTGWAQVNGFRGDTSIRGRIDCDLYYIENWTVGLDFKILFLTVFKGFVNKNAY